MRRLLKWLGVALGCFGLFCVGALTLGIINDETSAARTARLDADLRAKVPPGSNREQLQKWFTANGYGAVPEVSKPKPGEPVRIRPGRPPRTS